MPPFLILVIALIWLVGTLARIYQQARYYQIEEYKSPRYVRWLIAERLRWLPNRPPAAWFIGTAAGFMLAEAPGSQLNAIVGALFAVIAVWPPRTREVKKAFVRTGRATRILGTAFVVATVLLVGSILILNSLTLPDIKGLPAILTGFIGLIVFMLSPLFLIIGNVLMKPVEALFRWRFVARARAVLDKVQPTVIGITGSYGKTTTKSVLAHILNGRYKAFPTPKSYNTTMGVCIAINNYLADDYSIDYFIAEMGAYVPGEIKEICDVVHPTIGIMVEVGPQHLERFGSLENTAVSKYELIKALPADGVAVFNIDNPYIREMVDKGYPQTRLTVSKAITPDDAKDGMPRFIASNITETLNGLTFAVTDTHTGDDELFKTPVLGEHNVTNILLATAVAVHEGMSLQEVARRVQTLQPTESRLVRQVTTAGITIINDAYSANPVGVIGSLKVLGMHNHGKRLLITPGMIELGAMQDDENRKLGEMATHYATDIILVGEKQTEAVKQGVMATDFPSERLRVVHTLQEAIDWYQHNLRAGDTVLFLNDLPDTY